MQTLYVIKYNNYYNRKVLKLDRLSDYLVPLYYSGQNIPGISFNPNNGLKTTQIVNFKPNGDYVIIGDDSNDNFGIVSRWFIVDSTRQRTGQYNLTLKRDVFADNYSQIVSAKSFIERATLPDNDNFIFNKEGDLFNQIKISEDPIKDETECAWIVGYVPRDAFTGEEPTVIYGDIVSASAVPDIEVNGLENWEYFQYSNLSPDRKVASAIDVSNIVYNAYATTGIGPKYKYSWNKIGPVNTGWVTNPTIEGAVHKGDPIIGASYYVNKADYPDEAVSTHTFYIKEGQISGSNVEKYRTYRDAVMTGYTSEDFNVIDECVLQLYSNLTLSQANEIESLNNKILHDLSTDLYYQITVTGEYSDATFYSIPEDSTAFAKMVSKTDLNTFGLSDGSGRTPGSESYRVKASGALYTISLSQIVTGRTQVTINPETRAHLVDSPYDMFCMPYTNSGKIYLKNNDDIIETNGNTSLNMAINVGLVAGSASIYDVQLLPYCPLQGINVLHDNQNRTILDISRYPYNNIMYEGTNKVGALLWGTRSMFQKTIPYHISVSEPKVENQTDMYRICSPNYSTGFDFNAALNRGMDYFVVDCTYKPFDPYILIHPNFKALYGEDFDDSRGLICGGDYSIPQMTDAWADYVNQNKAYYANMNSTIATLSGVESDGIIDKKTVAQNYDRITRGTLGALFDSSQTKLGSDYISDVVNTRSLIAQETGLAKTSALTYNNRVFPFIEHYTCSEIEKQAFRNKLETYGMTVGRIGTISEFIQEVPSFISGKIIQIDIDNEDTNYINEINREFKKGIYI